jgi:hypothetical protein
MRRTVATPATYSSMLVAHEQEIHRAVVLAGAACWRLRRPAVL